MVSAPVRRSRSACLALLGALLATTALTATSAGAVVNPTLSGFVADTATLPGVTAVAVAGHYAYVTDYYAGRLSAIDISNPAAPVIAGSSPPLNELLNASTINIAGGYAFVASKNRNGPSGSASNDDGTGNALTILDITSNPASPAIVGTVRDANTLFGAYGVAVSGHYAYVASQGCLSGQPCPKPSAGNAFAVIDISNPAAPTIVAALHNSSLPSPWTGSGALLHATSVAISEGYAYVTAAYENRLTIISIANPLSPQIVASIKDKTNLAFPVDVAVNGRYAYVVDQIWPGRMAVVDISNPAEPHVVSLLESEALTGAYRIRIRGDFAYISASGATKVGVVDISNPLRPRLAATITSSAHLNKTTGLDLDPSGAHVVASSPYLSTETQPLYPPFALQPGGPTMTGTVSTITLDPSPIAVSIASESQPATPTAQTSASFSFSVNDAVSAVQCQLDGGSWAPCTTPAGQTYSGLGAGAHDFQVQAIDSSGNTATASYGWTITAPVNSERPAISGQASVGLTLSASSGSWTGSPSLAYQWLRCNSIGLSCLPIEGATASTYSPVGADAGNTLAVQVTATTSAGSTSAESSPTAPVTAPPAGVSPPSISGNPIQGETLSASPGTWSGYPAPSFSYQWNRCNSTGTNCAAITEATASTYTLHEADVGSTITVSVQATNTSGSAPASSSATAVIASPPGSLSAPVLSEVATQGVVLSVSPGSWSGSPAPSFTYQWNRCNALAAACEPIVGATGSTYTPLSADVGNTLTVTLTATNTAGSAQATSNPTGIVTAPPSDGSPPSITGNPVVGETLSASPGSWSGYPAPAFSYQWNRCNTTGINCIPIEEATTSTYKLHEADAGSTITVSVQATNTSGSTPASSSATAAIASLPVSVSTPTLPGAATEGEALSVSPGSWSGYPAPSFTYQWNRCNALAAACEPIVGATGSTYTPLSADVGNTLTVTLTATNTAGSAQATSNPTGMVASAAGPLTPLLDSFARPNNTGPPGPNWTHMIVSSSSATNDLYITGQQLTGHPGTNADYWNPQQYGPNSEVWVTVAVKPNVDQDPVVLGLRFQNPGAANASGYQAYYIFRSSQPDQYKIIRRTNGTNSTTLSSANGPTLKAGDELLFRAIGTTLELWREDAGVWTRILTATDTTYQGAGYLDLTARDSTVRLVNFGGGTLP